MTGGWIRVWRRLRDHPFWQEQRRFSKAEAWVDLLMRANFKDGKVLRGNRWIPVRRGQVFATQQELAARWGWDRKTVRAFLKALEADGMIAFETSKQTDTGYTLITIRNYECYQGRDNNGTDIKRDIDSTSNPHLENTDSLSNGHRRPTSKKNKKEEKGDKGKKGEGGAHSSPPALPLHISQPPPSISVREGEMARGVLQFFSQEFERRHGGRPGFAKKDTARAQTLLDRHGSAALREVISHYLDDDDPFLVQRGHPFALLPNRIGKYLEAKSPYAQVKVRLETRKTAGSVDAVRRFVERHQHERLGKE